MHAGPLVLWVLAAAPFDHAPLRLQFDKCPDIDQTTVSRVVSMELQAGLANERQGTITTAQAECTNGHVRLTIDDPVTGKSTSRTLDLAGQPRDLRSRLLGLAISEAVLASWLELQLVREPPLPEMGARVPAQTRRDAADITKRRLRVSPRSGAAAGSQIVAGPALRRFSSGLFTLGLSGSARRWLSSYPMAGLGLEVDGGYGRQSVPNVARASALSLSLAPCLLMRGDFGHLIATAGIGWRAGLALLAAEPENTLRAGGSALRAWMGPFLTVDLGVSVGRSLLLRAGVESGYALVPAHGRVDSARVVALEASWLGGFLALGTRL